MTDDLRIQLQEQARQAAYWKERAEYWRDLWSRTANRLMQVDPAFNEPNETVAEELRKLERRLSSDNPARDSRPESNPWKDV
jgi:hypothetical protein